MDNDNDHRIPGEQLFDRTEYVRTVPDQTCVPEDTQLRVSLNVDYPRIQLLTTEGCNSFFHQQALRTTLSDAVLNSSKWATDLPSISSFQSPSWINSRTKVDKLSVVVSFVGNATTTKGPVFIIPVFQFRRSEELDNLIFLTLTSSFGSLLVNVMDQDVNVHLRHLLESRDVPKIFLSAQYELQFYWVLLRSAVRNVHCITSITQQLAEFKGRRWDVITNDNREPLPDFNAVLQTDTFGDPISDARSLFRHDDKGRLVPTNGTYVVWDLLTHDYKINLPPFEDVFGGTIWTTDTQIPAPSRLEGFVIPSNRKVNFGKEIEENFKDQRLLWFIGETIMLYRRILSLRSDYPSMRSVMNWKRGLEPLLPYLKISQSISFWENVAEALDQNLNLYAFIPCWFNVYFREGHGPTSSVLFKSVKKLHSEATRRSTKRHPFDNKWCGLSSHDQKAFISCLTSREDWRFPIGCTCKETGSYHEILLRLEIIAPNFVHCFKQGYHFI